MTPQSNKNLIKDLTQGFSVSPEVQNFYQEVRTIDETQDLISSLNYNLNMLSQAEKKLSFMIGEVRSTIKKRI